MNVDIPGKEELNQLEQHLYAQAFYCFGVGADQEIYTEIEKRETLEKLSKGVQAVKYAICTNSILLAEMMNTVHQLQEDIDNTIHSDQNVERLKLLFNQYSDAFSELYGLPSVFIERVKGTKGINKRKSNYLNRKYKIFYDILRQEVEVQGKFKNAKQAVEHVIDEVELAFKEFDYHYASERINEIKKKIEGEEQALERLKVSKSPAFAIRPKSTKKRIEKLKIDLAKWSEALRKDELYSEFSGIFLLKPINFLDKILARNLRKQEMLYAQVVEKTSKT
ncbi:hypothetical protein L313_1577 [Acinetobacter haemolyticus CIP 64.3 = MTCC 9819]|uniref:Uncharacterized protein n=1 Tax=Acinetobacter haemolyticus CIP 64.3 = MTCC 9819 TaxID=1217659 RepID=N9F4G5_ACIHA|nr:MULTISPECIES: hypothetical protein [Acinetobacter]ENU31301.1 hypothetical protein F991_00770 [Acinetobacter sp. CIP-A165]ENW17417.1 hypothetical protein F927_02127 [Acinetobacter haemolyticus CIP 64.3 = MTCC 9819]EPR89245.1 hypothetical protein L313_1577 [Acinetobacter haemolyticus CIP 64.3 = MTCC 9819]NAS03804.1 hypothetical protein [Acinetobacter haemolyticus]QHI31954.1 hypothetical protein Ahae11616_04345 [Acinetobacter haemolyticus]